MAVTVSVDATWRFSQVMFSGPWAPNGEIVGWGEYLLQEPVDFVPGAPSLTPGGPTELSMKGTSEGGSVYGVMTVAPVVRIISDVKDETVEIDGVTLSVEAIMSAVQALLNRWQAEDVANPPLVPHQSNHPPLPLPPKF